MNTTYKPRQSRLQAKLGFTLVEVLIVMLIMSILAALSWQGISTVVNSLQVTQDHETSISSIQSSLSQWQSDLDATLSLMPAPGVHSIDWDGKVLRLVRRAPALGNPFEDMGYQVVAWSARELTSEEVRPLGAGSLPGLYWLRWQSLPVKSTQELTEALEMANAWSQTASAPNRSRETALFPISQWQIYFYRENAWSNALSSAGSSPGISASASNNASNASSNSTASPSNNTSTPSQTSFAANLQQQLPSGIRLKIDLPSLNRANALNQDSNAAVSPSNATSQGSLTLDWARPSYTPVKS